MGLDPDAEGVTQGDNAIAYWGVQNADEALRRLLELGASRRSDVQEVGAKIRTATVVDPFGNVLGIIENPHFRIESER